MRRILITIAVCLVSFACGEAPTGASSSDGIIPGPSFKAEVQRFHVVRFPFSNSQLWAPTKAFEGWFNVTVHEVTSASGQELFRFHVASHVKGVGRTTGTAYVSNDVTNWTVHAGKATTETFQFRIVRIGKGKGTLWTGSSST